MIDAVESTCGPRAELSRFTIKRAKHDAPNWINCVIIFPIWEKSGKFYSKDRGKLMYQSIPSVITPPPGQTPGEFFEVVKSPAPG